MLKSWKKYTLRKCISITAKTFQQMIRIEAADVAGYCRCVTCGTERQWNQGFEMQAGHFVASRCNAILFDERNTHPQCSRCNVYLGGNQEAYAKYMYIQYGQNVIDDLNHLRNTTRTFTREELADMRIEFMDRIKVAKERLQ